MSMLVGTRLWRPSATALILVLLVALMAPLVIAPAPARADVCDLPGISDVCDAPGDIASTASAVANGVADATTGVIKGVVKGVKAAATWAGDNADKIVKAAALAGIGLATWVACSKVLKVVAVAGAGAASGAGTAGAGAVPGAVAGAAGAAAACQLLRKGTKLVLKVGKAGAKNGGKLANIAKLSAGAVGLAAIVYGTDHAAAWVLQNLLALDAPSAPNLDAGWLTSLRSGLNGMAAVLLLVATILGMTLAGVMGRASDVGRIFTSMISVALIIGVVGSLLLAGLRISDDVTSGTLNSTWGQQALGNWNDLGDSYAKVTPKTDDPPAADADAGASDDDTAGASSTSQTGTPPADEKGPWPIRLLVAFCTVIFGALVWLEMQIRDGLLYLLLAFGGLLLAGYPFPATRGIAQRFGMTLLGVVVAKPVIVITLLIGGSMMQSAAAGTDDGAIVPLLQGAGLMALAALMGSAILAWFNLHGASAMSGLGNRMMARGGGAAMAGAGAGVGAAAGAIGNLRNGGDDGPSATDPTKDLSKDTGDRVDAANDPTGPGPSPGGPNGPSPRLQAAQDREQAGVPGAPDSAAGDIDEAPLGRPTGADAPTQEMPTTTPDADAAAPSAGRATDQPDASDDDGRSSAPAATATAAAAGLAAGAAAGAAARGTTDSGGQQPTGVAGASAPAAEQLVAAQAGGTSNNSGAGAPTRADAGAPSFSATAPQSGPAASPEGPQGAVPDPPTVARFGRADDGASQTANTAQSSTSDDAAYAAFGAPAPQDAAAAFGEHATKVRAALNDRPEVKA